MNENAKLLAVKAAIYEMGLRFNQQPTAEKINAYALDLVTYTPEQITFAFREIINSGSAFFPSIAEIISKLKPKEEKREDKAPRIVMEMIKALRDFSQYDESRMLASVSPEARAAFEILGSTHDIRISEEIEIAKAQLERLVKSALSREESVEWQGKLAKVGIREPGLHSVDFNNIAKQLTE